MLKNKWGLICFAFLALMMTASFWFTSKVGIFCVNNDIEIYKSIDNINRQTDDLYSNNKYLSRQGSYQYKQIQALEKRIANLEELNGDKQTKLMRTIVLVELETGGGTGIILSSGDTDGDGDIETYILTAKHVVNNVVSRPKNQVTFFGYSLEPETLDYKLISMSDKYDLACILVESDIRIRQYARLASHLPTKVTKVVSIGFPYPYNSPVVTEGLYSGEYRDVANGGKLWHVSTSINYGNSGGGTFNLMDGTIIGVIVRFEYAHTGLIVPIHHVIEYLDGQQIPYHIHFKINFLNP